MKKPSILPLLISFSMFVACQTDTKTEDKESESDTLATITNENSTATASEEKKEESEALFIELTFEGGPLDGETLLAKTDFSAFPQARVSKGEPVTLAFSKADDESKSLEFSFDLQWVGDWAEGEKEVLNEASEIEIRNVEKEAQYDFGRLEMKFGEAIHKLTKVEEWKEKISGTYTFIEGEGKITTSNVKNTVSEREVKTLPNVNITFKYRAKVEKSEEE